MIKKLDQYDWFTIIAVFVAIVIFCASCASQKKLDSSATKRVLANADLKKKVFRLIEPDFPCVNDTFTKLLPGETIIKSDTFEIPIYSTDTLEVSQAIIKWKERVITRNIIRVDTLRLTVEDVRRLNIATDSMHYYKGLMIQAKADAAEYKKERNTARRNLWILIVLLIGTAVWYYIKKVNPKISVKL